MTPTLPSPAGDRIRTLNDCLRSQFIGGEVMITQGIQSLGSTFRATCIAAVRAYDQFTPANDPYGEHGFGMLTVLGQRVYWKIDYYDTALQYASPDPSDPSLTTRVLTILLATEY